MMRRELVQALLLLLSVLKECWAPLPGSLSCQSFPGYLIYEQMLFLISSHVNFKYLFIESFQSPAIQELIFVPHPQCSLNCCLTAVSFKQGELKEGNQSGSVQTNTLQMHRDFWLKEWAIIEHDSTVVMLMASNEKKESAENGQPLCHWSVESLIELSLVPNMVCVLVLYRSILTQ